MNLRRRLRIGSGFIVGRRDAAEPPDGTPEMAERQAKNLGRKLRLCSPEWIRANVTEERAESAGLVDEWRMKVRGYE